MRRFLSCVISVSLFCGASLAQQKSIKFDKYSIEDGLSQSSVTSVVQDKFGFIWIATQDGLNKFNGYDFEVLKHNPKDISTIPDNYIHCVTEDRDGYLWIGTNRGIARINPKSHHVDRVNRENFPDLKGYVFNAMEFDAAGHLWVVSENNGISRINFETREVNNIRSISGNFEFTDLMIDSKHVMWIGTKTGQVYWAAPPYQKFSDISYNTVFSIFSINQIYEGQTGQIYVATEQGIYTVSDSRKLSVAVHQPDIRLSDVQCVYEQDSSSYWIGTAEKGLFKVLKDDLGRKSVIQYTKNPHNNTSLLDNNVSYIFEDKSGVFWLGTEKGLAKFDKYKQGFTTVSINDDPEKGLVDYSVWSFAEDARGYIYIGTKKDLTIYDPAHDRYHHLYREKGAAQSLLCMHIESPQELWLGYEDGLFKLQINDLVNDDYQFRKIDFLAGDPRRNEIVYQIVPADENRLWIGSKAGLSILDKKTLRQQFYSASESTGGLGEGAVKVIYRDLSGKMWISTTNAGLFNIIEKADGSFKFKNVPIEDQVFFKSNVTSILQTEKNNLWISTYGAGIRWLNLRSKKSISYTELEGLSNNVVYGLLEDKDGNIWASTNKGISKLNPRTEVFTTFSVKDGLQSNEFNSGAFMKSRLGKLYFGGIDGFNIFDPAEININPNAPQVLISKVFMSARSSQERDLIAMNIHDSIQIELNYFENDLTFEFASTNYSNPSKTKFKYILENHEADYNYIEEENRVHYMNIPHGAYTFKVYAQSTDGLWSEQPAILSVIITPPFWLTWWFRILIIVVATGIGFVLYRRRIDIIRRQKVRLEIEVVKRTRQISEQSKKLTEQKERVELQKQKIEHQKELLEKEKEKVEQLLLNILPEGTAEELKDKGRSKARYYKNVSVMFTDFVAFSKIAEDMRPQDLVTQLDSYFSKFDEIIEQYDLEKIKTIGDSYMCAGGVPIRNKSNAIEVTLAALEIKNYMEAREIEAQEKNEKHWKIRIGINTGEVIAGVIGLKRFAYDIWGATVNQAQRMEMHGQPGTVNASGNTYEYVAPYFECTYRGKIQTKHKGMLDMYNVNKIKPELSIDGKGRKPNKKFWKIVDLHLYSSINYMKAERHIMKLLEQSLSPKLLYHSINHTVDVTKAAERLAIMEGITDEDLFLLKSAASYHDAGFIEKYERNEGVGVRLAGEILPKYGYTAEQIKVIDSLIRSTEVPHNPKTRLEEIMCDADLDYLGRDDFHDIASLLRRELREHGKLDSDRKWDEIQLKFLNEHRYFTRSALKLRQAKKQKNVQDVEERLRTYHYKD